jgi:hypothetical protein
MKQYSIQFNRVLNTTMRANESNILNEKKLLPKERCRIAFAGSLPSKLQPTSGHKSQYKKFSDETINGT